MPLLLPYFLGLPCTLHLRRSAWSRDFRIHYHFSNSLFPSRGPSWNNHAHREDNFNLQPVRVRRTVNLLWLLFFVPRAGIEPALPLGNYILSVAGLPIPPPRRGSAYGTRTHISALRGPRPNRLDECAVLERVIGIEPTSSAWRADALTVVLYPRTQGTSQFSVVSAPKPLPSSDGLKQSRTTQDPR